jgi:hypothetical protein
MVWVSRIGIYYCVRFCRGVARDMINYDGIIAFCPEYVEGFPFKVISYRGGVYMVPDWSVNHDAGDEDDGEHKLLLQWATFARTVSL